MSNYIEKKEINEEDVKYALDILSGKWKLKIMIEIWKNESIRFNQLEKNVDGISSLMLTRCLRELVEYKIIERKQFNEIPPHVEYSLTKIGKSICPIIHSLEEWGNKVKSEINKK
ncbi:MAG: helix-turn-helix transcriptional regulator [Clostridium sp.]|nr:helix-turn-helix transcriptional regulator [Clostridium sp.]